MRPVPALAPRTAAASFSGSRPFPGAANPSPRMTLPRSLVPVLLLGGG